MTKTQSEVKMSFIVYNKIDEGNFGKIYLIRKNGGIDDQKTYAMKTINPDPDQSTAENRQICCNELKIFKLVHNIPFFLQLKYAFKTEQNYHFVMEYIPGGNLYEFLNGDRLTLQEAIVCCAEIICAIAYLHEHRVVYRDLKLENILIANDGHLLLTDFGLARKVRKNNQMNDEAGTCTYFAPEMISGSKEHSYEVDWWACGIAICELLFGHSPFLRTANENAKEPEMCNRILNEEPNLSEIRLISGSNISKLEIFIKALLVKDPKQRLGAGQKGYGAVKSHDVFKSINWTAVMLKKYKCLDLDKKRNTSTQGISIDFADQCNLVFREKGNGDFQYVAPELQSKIDADDDSDENIDEINGSTDDDFDVLSTRIELPNSIGCLDVLLTKGLFIRTDSVGQVIRSLKQLIIPQKSVRFSLVTLSPKAKTQHQQIQFQPYMPNVRRSNRIAGRRFSTIL